jgi:phenylalanine-4-hydroxylase
MQESLQSASNERYVSFETSYPAMLSEGGVTVWRTAWHMRAEFLRDCASAIPTSYLRGVRALHLHPDGFPTLPELNDALSDVGWQVAWVPGFIPNRIFADLIRRRIFPIAAGVRAPEFIDHAPTPDALHDIWGHLPFLFDESYTEYLLSIADAILQAPPNPREALIFDARTELGKLESAHAAAAAIREAQCQLDDLEALERTSPPLATRLSRLFLWSIEFGLIGEPQDFMILGSAILSSPREAFGVIRNPPSFRPFTIDATEHEILFSEPQQQLFIAPRFDAYNDVLQQCVNKFGY